MKRIKIIVKAQGKTKEDIILALEQAVQALREGSLSGHDSNDSGEYGFDVTGEEMP